MSASVSVFDSALSITKRIVQNIRANLKEHSENVDERVVSLAGEVVSVVRDLEKGITDLKQIVSQAGESRVIRLLPNTFLVIEKDWFHYVQTKPETVVVAYKDGEISVKSKGFEATFSPGELKVKHRAVSAIINASNLEDLSKNREIVKSTLEDLRKNVRDRFLVRAEASLHKRY